MSKKILQIGLIVMLISLLVFGYAFNKIKKNNKDFEYIKEGKVTKLNISNVRDKGFKLVVTDERAINEIYDILSSAKTVDTKSDLEPDYVFEFYTEEDKMYKFNYISGLSGKFKGNFYSDNKNYVVSKNIDNDVINNFSYINRPREFNEVYYTSILDTIKEYRKDTNYTESIGVDFSDDVDIARFLLSVDLKDFSDKLKYDKYKATIIKAGDNSNNIVMKIKTEGYSTDKLNDTGVYKIQIVFENKSGNSQKVYYLSNKYNDKKWDINIYKDKAPEDF